MNKEQVDVFLQNLADILDVEKEDIDVTTDLSSIEDWDSLSIVSFAAMADIKYSKKLVARDIKKAKTVNDLLLLVTKEQ